MSSKTTNSVTNLNYSTNTRGVIEIHAAPEILFNCIGFNIPGISTSAPLQPTPFTDIPIRGDTLIYAPLEVSFIVTEDLRNWELAVNWIEGFTAPKSPEQWINKKFEYSDATVFLYNSHNNLEIQVEFTGLTPTFVGGLRFDTTSESVVELVCDMTFEYQSFSIINIKKRQDNTNIG